MHKILQPLIRIIFLSGITALGVTLCLIPKTFATRVHAEGCSASSCAPNAQICTYPDCGCAGAPSGGTCSME